VIGGIQKDTTANESLNSIYSVSDVLRDGTPGGTVVIIAINIIVCDIVIVRTFEKYPILNVSKTVNDLISINSILGGVKKLHPCSCETRNTVISDDIVIGGI
jgi:hypothetical protein